MTPIEQIGMVISTAGTAPYIHLQLEMARRMYGDTMPTLVVNDGDGSHDAAEKLEVGELARLCNQYNVEFHALPRIGHAVGDLRAFVDGLKWAKELGVEILTKFSRRYVPLVNWRHGLTCVVSSNMHAASFGRRNCDRPDGMFRTDCIALRVRKWDNERVNEIFAETLKRDTRTVVVENLMLSLTRVLGGWEFWDLVGEDMHRAYPLALQWRAVTPCYYCDLSRELDLPYTDKDFIRGTLTFERMAEMEPQGRPVPMDVIILDQEAPKAMAQPDEIAA